MGEAGTCPTCGRTIVDPEAAAEDEPAAPWHFKLLIVGVVLYLGWRGVEALDWVVRQLT
jgi:hypothetical protein